MRFNRHPVQLACSGEPPAADSNHGSTERMPAPSPIFCDFTLMFRKCAETPVSESVSYRTDSESNAMPLHLRFL